MASTLAVERFGGLGLLHEQQDVGINRATAMLNAEIGRDATEVSCRRGLGLLGAGTSAYYLIAPTTYVNGPLRANALILCRQAVASLDAAVDAIDVATGTVTNLGTIFHGAGFNPILATSITTYGTSETALLTLIASHNPTDGIQGNLKQYDGTTFADFAPASKPRFLAVTPWDFRLVQACYVSAADAPGGANGSLSTVYFSDPGIPTTFGANNFLRLRPFDGEEIVGMVTWRDLLFVSKRSNLFVVYNTDLSATGNPRWDTVLRRIELPSRCRKSTTSSPVMCAGPDGVYMLLGDGVYRTTGGIPEKVSRQIQPLFDGTGDATMLVPAASSWNLSSAGNRVFLTYTVAGTFRSLVFDTDLGEWMLWDTSAGTGFQPSNVTQWVDSSGAIASYIAAGAKVLANGSGTTDDGAGISWNYQSGYSVPAGGQRIVQRGSSVWGSGVVNLQMLTRGARAGDVADPGVSLTLGVAPTVAEGKRRRAIRGAEFAHKLSGTGPATVTAVTHRFLSPEEDV